MFAEAPLVSAIVPVFNGETFISDAIESILAQTYPNIECIVVDDGSVDRTEDVVRQFEKVRYLQKDNGGVSSARNYGAENAGGRYLAFLDADDVWLPEKIERQMELAERRPLVGMVYTGLHLVDETLTRLTVMEAPAPISALRNTLLLEPPVMSVAQTGLVPAAVFNASEGFDERLSTSADTDFACRLACRYEVDAVFEPLALYRQHGRQMHHDPGAMERDMLLAFDKLFDDAGLPDDIARLRNRAYANLYATLAAAHLHDGARARFLSHFLKALRFDPLRVGALALRRLTR